MSRVRDFRSEQLDDLDAAVGCAAFRGPVGGDRRGHAGADRREAPCIDAYWEASASTTAPARRADSAWLQANPPLPSVWPTIITFQLCAVFKQRCNLVELRLRNRDEFPLCRNRSECRKRAILPSLKADAEGGRVEHDHLVFHRPELDDVELQHHAVAVLASARFVPDRIDGGVEVASARPSLAAR
jgi:hypothetical protein